MISFKQFNEDTSRVPQLSPSFFFSSKETWETIEEYTADLLMAIKQVKHSSITKVHKKILSNLVEDPDDNCLRGTTVTNIGKEMGNFIKRINSHFGELVGPIKIIKDDNYMPWINTGKRIYIPKKSAHPFLDYIITDSEGQEHKISAKSAKQLGNTIKSKDIVQVIDDAMQNNSINSIMNKLFVGQGEGIKYKTEYKIIQQVFSLSKTEKTIPSILKTAALFDSHYGEGEFSSVVDQLDQNFYGQVNYRVLDNELPPNKNWKTIKELLKYSDIIIKKYSKPPYPISRALRLMVNLVFKDNIYFSKFAVNNNGSPIWKKRGRKTEHSNMYAGETTQFTKLYFDAKGARGKDKVGLRIEEREK